MSILEADWPAAVDLWMGRFQAAVTTGDNEFADECLTSVQLALAMWELSDRANGADNDYWRVVA